MGIGAGGEEIITCSRKQKEQKNLYSDADIWNKIIQQDNSYERVFLLSFLHSHPILSPHLKVA